MMGSTFVPQKESVCHLQTIPSEVLKVVAEGAGGHAVASLWRCCNRVVNHKLSAASGISTFDLWLPNTTRLSVFPSLLTELKGLETVRIELRKDVGAMPVLTTILLSSLSPRIKEISLRFKEAEECWKRCTARQQGTDIWKPTGEAPFDFAKCFPNLQILKLVAPTPHQNFITNARSTDAPTPVFGSLEDHDLTHLPETLRVLELPSNNKITHIGIKHLPPLLETLNLTWIDDTISLEWAHALPQHLHSLILTRCSKFEESWFSLLPRTLEHLDIRHCSTIRGESFSDLPPGLLYFNVEFSSKIQSQTLGLLPRKLTYLNIGDAKSVSDKDIASLPSFLTYLDIWSANVTSKCFALLPENLLTLKLGKHEGTFGADSIVNLPKNLTHLNMEMANIEPEAVKCLPQGLIVLNLRACKNIKAAQFQDLPRKLQRLCLPETSSTPDSRQHKSLPKGLKDVPFWWL